MKSIKAKHLSCRGLNSTQLLFNNKNGPLIDILSFLNIEEIRSFSLINEECYDLITDPKFKTIQHKFQFYCKSSLKYFNMEKIAMDYCLKCKIAVPMKSKLNYLGHLIKTSNFEEFRIHISKILNLEEFRFLFRQCDDSKINFARIILNHVTSKETYSGSSDDFHRYATSHCIENNYSILLELSIIKFKKIFGSNQKGIFENYKKCNITSKNYRCWMKILINFDFEFRECDNVFGSCLEFMDIKEIQDISDCLIESLEPSYLLEHFSVTDNKKFFKITDILFKHWKSMYDDGFNDLDIEMFLNIIARSNSNIQTVFSYLDQVVGYIDFDSYCRPISLRSFEGENMSSLGYFLNISSIELIKEILKNKSIINEINTEFTFLKACLSKAVQNNKLEKFKYLLGNHFDIDKQIKEKLNSYLDSGATIEWRGDKIRKLMFLGLKNKNND